MNEKKAASRGEGKGYHNSYQSLADVWGVLARHSSPEHPMTVKEIQKMLKACSDDVPSLATINRLLPAQAEALKALFPQSTLCQAGEPSVSGTYLAAGTLHVVLENPEGEPLWDGDMAAVLSPRSGEFPSYSTIDKLLQRLMELNPSLFPYQLQCVKARRTPSGQTQYIPYADWELKLSEEEAAKNNQPRRYYLQSVLTPSEWRIFSDLVAVYPYITEAQTRKFLSVLSDLTPGKVSGIGSRFAFKRGSERQFAHIAVLDEAIRTHQKVRVTYGEWVLAKGAAWKPRLQERKKNSVLEFAPYALTWSNGYYYLMGKNRGMMNLRVDRILAVKMLPEQFPAPVNFDPVACRDQSPVMYPGERKFVHLRCRLSLVNILVDFFGQQAQYSAPKGDWVEVTMFIAPAGVKLFALQYLDSVEVLEPATLRDEIREALRAAMEVYRR